MNRRLSLLSVVATLTLALAAVAAPPEGKDANRLGKPVLVPTWKKTTVGLEKEEDFQATLLQPIQKWVHEHLSEVVKMRQAQSKPLIAPSVPIGAGNVVVYTTERCVVARALRDLEGYDPPIKAGELEWESELRGSLVMTAHYDNGRPMIDGWIRRYRASSTTDPFFHRTLRSSMQLGKDYVHGIDELGLVPPDDIVIAGYDFKPVAHRIYENLFKSWYRRGGRLYSRIESTAWLPTPQPKAPFRVILGGFAVDSLWYLLCLQNAGLELLCISGDKFANLRWHDRSLEAEQECKVWRAEIVPCVKSDRLFQSLQNHFHHRIHARHLVKIGSLIICPTYFSNVVALDAKSGAIKWNSAYSEPRLSDFPTFAPEWIVVPPVVVGDKYIYAPADFPELLCLNVADGKKVWSVKKGDGLYPAFVGEQVLVIGEKSIRSLSLKDGSEVWKTEIPGLPCGRGAMLGDTYLLPVSEPKTWRGMIAMVDVKSGKIVEVIKPETDEPIGNLVVHQDFLISQTLTEIAVFPIKKN